MITTTTASLVVLAIATVLGIIGYFLRMVHTDVRRVVEEQGQLKGKIELVEQESRLKYQAIQEQTQIELKNLAKNVGDLTDTVRQLVTIR
jgi:uncharacterized protein YsxB (DUF464 family)